MLFKRILKRIFTEFYIYLPIKKNKNIAENLIVSLTSYPARLKSLHVVIRSLLKQSLLPEKIILYLGTDTKENDIPKKLIKLTKYNFEIKKNYEDLKPHKKYIFAMQEYPNHTIITVDDDIIYDKNLVKSLVESSKKNPGCVCARRVHLMTKNEENKLNPYSKWKWECKNIKEASHALFATGVGGVLYPPSIFTKEAFDTEKIKEHCLNTDDIWLKYMEIKNNVKVVFTDNKIIHPLTLRKTQDSGLLKTNTEGENRNDINIKCMENFTGIKLEDYI